MPAVVNIGPEMVTPVPPASVISLPFEVAALEMTNQKPSLTAALGIAATKFAAVSVVRVRALLSVLGCRKILLSKISVAIAV